MIEQFWFYFLGTGIITRILTPPFHFRNKTPTHFLRTKTQKNIHHIHIGLVFAIASLFIIILHGLNKPLLFFGAVGLSFIADEIFLMKNFSDYFSKKGFLLSIVGHLIIGVAITLLLIWAY